MEEDKVEKVVVAETKKGNPYHSKETGRFVSKGEEGEATSKTEPIDKKRSRLAALFGDGKEQTDSPKNKLSSLFNGKADRIDISEDELLLARTRKKEWRESVTLERYEKYRENIIKYKLHVLSSEQEKVLENTWKRVYKNSLLGTRARVDVLWQIICNNSWLMNQFESKSSGGYYGPSRYTFSVNAFGLPITYVNDKHVKAYNLSKLEEEKLYKLEKYGCVANADPKLTLASTDDAMGYGGCYMAFKKDKVANTTTVSFVDSLGRANRQDVEPSLCYNIDEFSFDEGDRNSVKRQINDMANVNDIDEFKEKIGYVQYAELQFHRDKPITVNDIESIYLHRLAYEDPQGKEVCKVAHEKGIKVYIQRDMDASSVVSYEDLIKE